MENLIPANSGCVGGFVMAMRKKRYLWERWGRRIDAHQPLCALAEQGLSCWTSVSLLWVLNSSFSPEPLLRSAIHSLQQTWDL